MRSAAAHLGGRLMFTFAQINDMSQEPIGSPFHITDLGDHFGLTQWTRLSTSGDPNRVPRGGGAANGILSITKG
jgi:hypothetical protein